MLSSALPSFSTLSHEYIHIFALSLWLLLKSRDSFSHFRIFPTESSFSPYALLPYVWCDLPSRMKQKAHLPLQMALTHQLFTVLIQMRTVLAGSWGWGTRRTGGSGSLRLELWVYSLALLPILSLLPDPLETSKPPPAPASTRSSAWWAVPSKLEPITWSHWPEM